MAHSARARLLMTASVFSLICRYRYVSEVIQKLQYPTSRYIDSTYTLISTACRQRSRVQSSRHLILGPLPRPLDCVKLKCKNSLLLHIPRLLKGMMKNLKFACCKQFVIFDWRTFQLRLNMVFTNYRCAGTIFSTTSVDCCKWQQQQRRHWKQF
jgi:hypothetical protein